MKGVGGDKEWTRYSVSAQFNQQKLLLKFLTDIQRHIQDFYGHIINKLTLVLVSLCIRIINA
jgi:hypothetical protein